MKLALFWWGVILTFCFPSFSAQTVNSQTQNQKSESGNIKSRSPVLVELFTSAGCPNCPPADTALAFLEKEQPYAQAEIITLALHVDYWNRADWRDEYSLPLFSQRQMVYVQKFKLNSAYTPQMIVDGQAQVIGTKLGEVAKAIFKAAGSPRANFVMAVEEKNDRRLLKIEISEMPRHTNSTVFLAIAENNLISNVQRGENAGKILEHSSVVRELKAIGKIEAGADEFSGSIAFNLDPRWTAKNVRFVLFVQENESRKVHGAARITVE